MDIFKIRKREIPALVVGMTMLLVVNGLMIAYKYELFTRGGNLGFWTIFHDHFTLSGYDPYMYITLSRWKIYYTLSRHPLLTLLLYPLAMLNGWLMDITGCNCAIFIMAVLYTLCGTYTFLFTYRIANRLIGLGRADSLLLSVLFFSFGHIMAASATPDHFALSLFLLSLTLYIAGSMMQEGRKMPAWLTALLATATAGVTLTNGAKIWLAAWWTNGRAFWRPRHIAVAVGLPLAIMGGCYWAQYENMVKPDNEIQTRNIEKRMKKDKKFAKKFMAHQEWMKHRRSFNDTDNSVLEWIDTKTSRTATVVENLFGESFQFHRDYLLQDTNMTRPVIVSYRSWYSYAVEAVLVILFLAGCVCGWPSAFFRLVLSWFAVDMTMHMVLGFALTEVYIMASHWAVIVPIAMGFLLARLHGHWQTAMRMLTILITVWLLAWNGTLLATHLLGL